MPWSIEDAEQCMRACFARHVPANAQLLVSGLPSYDDFNFRVTVTPAGAAACVYVLKVANQSMAVDVLHLQTAAHLHINACDASLTQNVLPHDDTADGPDAHTCRYAGHLVRLMTFLPGAPLGEVMFPRPPAMLQSVGAMLARVQCALAGFDHPAAGRVHDWSLQSLGRLQAAYLPLIADLERAAHVAAAARLFDASVMPLVQRGVLPVCVLHGDANEYNVLVDEAAACATGVIDFGDMSRGPRVFDLAICLAYLALGEPDPFDAMCAVLRGYAGASAGGAELSDDEVAALFACVGARLAQSVLMSTNAMRAAPDNAYIAISQAPAFLTLGLFAAVSPAWAHYAFRTALGRTAVPHSAALVRAMRAAAVQPLMEAAPGRDVLIAMGADAPVLAGVDATDGPAFARAVAAALAAQPDTRFGLGAYGEDRVVYRAPAYASPPAPATAEHTARRRAGWRGEARSVHVGVDVFAPAGSPVYAPLDGVVHSFADNAAPQDYGPTIVLQHSLADPLTGASMPLFTLYGHLARSSLAGLREGMPVRAGARVGVLGSCEENGGWPPHVHFQCMADMCGRRGDFEGVVRPAHWALYASLTPDPNLLLRLAALPEAPAAAAALAAAAAAATAATDALLARRHAVLGPGLSLMYSTGSPVHAVRGEGARLIDAAGMRLLDCVNNVAQVGHCHPRVVAAAAAQLARHNTNARYLDAHVVAYAEALLRRFPPELNRVYFVNSGSEANDLALRIARAHSGGSDVVVMDGAYHGHTAVLIDISPYKFDGAGGAGRPPHVQVLPMPDTYRGEHNDPATAGPLYARAADAALARIAERGARVAAFFGESILGCGGQVVPPPGYFAHVYAAVRAAGGVCIADEVQCGFGRVGDAFWGFELHGVVPDIVTMAKPIGNGFPLAAVVVRASVAASFANGMEYFNTYGGGPVASAIGLEVLRVIDDEGLQAHAAAVGAWMLAQLRGPLFDRHALIGDARGRGMFLGIELVRSRATREPAAREATRVVNTLRTMGVLLSTDGPLHNVLKFKPPLVFSLADAAEFVAKLDTALATVAALGDA